MNNDNGVDPVLQMFGLDHQDHEAQFRNEAG